MGQTFLTGMATHSRGSAAAAAAPPDALHCPGCAECVRVIWRGVWARSQAIAGVRRARPASHSVPVGRARAHRFHPRARPTLVQRVGHPRRCARTPIRSAVGPGRAARAFRSRARGPSAPREACARSPGTRRYAAAARNPPVPVGARSAARRRCPYPARWPAQRRRPHPSWEA